METLSLQRIKESRRIHRIKLKSVRIIVIGKAKIPETAFQDRMDLITAKLQRKFPETYKQYFLAAKKRAPKVYNGNYASTINSFSLGFRHDQCE